MKKTISALMIAASIVWFSPSYGDDSPISINQGLKSLLNSMAQGTMEFPARFSTSAIPAPDQPDMSFFIHANHLNDLVTAYMKHPLVLGKKDSKTKASTLVAKNVKIAMAPDRNVIQVFIKNGELNLSQAYAGIQGKLLVNDAEMEVFPRIIETADHHIMLECKVRLVHLDIEKTAPVIDIGLANLLQELYLNDQVIESINLSEHISQLSLSDRISVNLKKGSVRIKKEGLIIEASWLISS